MIPDAFERGAHMRHNVSGISSKLDNGGPTAEEERRAGWEWPTDFRKFMGWIFLATSLQYLTISVRAIPYAIHYHHAVPLVRILLVAPAFSVVVAAISGVAWWTVWKGKSSARVWAIAASLINILIFARQFIIPLQDPWYQHVGALFIGVVGLGTFLRPEGRRGT
jgi:hypothetical protein